MEAGEHNLVGTAAVTVAEAYSVMAEKAEVAMAVATVAASAAKVVKVVAAMATAEGLVGVGAQAEVMEAGSEVEADWVD